jgi:membrane protein implicated in regulation of membrane protease activity
MHCIWVGSSSFVTSSSSIELAVFSALSYVIIIIARRIGSQLRNSYRENRDSDNLKESTNKDA